MKLKSISKQFDLQPESIDDFSDWLTQQLELLKMEKRNRIRVLSTTQTPIRPSKVPVTFCKPIPTRN